MYRAVCGTAVVLVTKDKMAEGSLSDHSPHSVTKDKMAKGSLSAHSPHSNLYQYWSEEGDLNTCWFEGDIL